MKSQNEELVEKCNKMALLLGIVRCSLGGMVECSSVSMESKKNIASLLEFLTPRIDELFYNSEPIKDKPFKGAVFIDDPYAFRKKCAEPYNKEWQNRCTICNGYHDGLGQAPCKPLNCS